MPFCYEIEPNADSNDCGPWHLDCIILRSDQRRRDERQAGIVEVCDSCIDIGYDAGFMTYGEQADMMRMMGADVEDHLCDEIETDGEVRCGCGCRGVR